MTDLGAFGGLSIAFDVNDAGQVVGMSETATGDRRAFVWQEGAMEQLPELDRPDVPEGDSRSVSFAYGIKQGGQIVGTSGGHAVLWT
jgi:probable HAF family extracellular repeat protein